MNRTQTWGTLWLCFVVALLWMIWNPEKSSDAILAAQVRPARFTQETVVLDPGHGGEDGGAVSPSGVAESHLNLAIGQKTDLLLGFFGVDVQMIRDEDISIYDQGAETLRDKKNSDLKNRVAIIEDLEQATLISIHQNSFAADSSCSGAQVFYASTPGSDLLSRHTQESLRQMVAPNNARVAAPIAQSVYLFQHISCRAIMVECGFLTNPMEEQLLPSEDYQRKLAAGIAGAYLGFEET